MKCQAVVVLALLATACSGPSSHERLRGRDDLWVRDAISTASIDAALVRQRTIYPYHFVDGTARLNELGHRDIHVIVAHLAKAPAPLNLRRGDEPHDLYEARVRTITAVIADYGVTDGRIPVGDGRPGGTGIASGKVRDALKPDGAAETQNTIIQLDV